MCSRVLATIFIIYYFNSGLCADLIDFSCKKDGDCMGLFENGTNVTCVNDDCVCTNFDGTRIQCRPPTQTIYNKVGGRCPCSIANAVCGGQSNQCFCRSGFMASDDSLRCIEQVVHLGNNCEKDNQCGLAEQFSQCDSETKICRCLMNYTPFQNACLSLLSADMQCELRTDCDDKISNSRCVESRCVCTDGYVSNHDQSKCLASVTYGEDCLETVQCKRHMGANFLCDKGKCSCTRHHYHEKNHTGSHCKQKISVGGWCEGSHQCDPNDSNTMECFQGVCTCRNGYIEKDQICIPKSSDGNIIFLGKSLCLLSVFIQCYFILS